MLGIATLLALAAVGTFVGWAISHGLLGPAVRVAIGLAAAAALALWGLRLRRTERSFGASMLGLALAITHVCAWAAGPSLHLVPPLVALLVSSSASAALAVLALLDEDEPLWCVGFGGAAVAPFVTSTGQGTAPILAGYAAVVLVLGGFALGARPWPVAAKVFGAACVLFTGALLAMPEAQSAQGYALALDLLVAGSIVFFSPTGEVLRPRLRTLGLLAAISAHFVAYARPLEALALALLLALPFAAWLVLLDRAADSPPGRLLDGFWRTAPAIGECLDGALLPLLFLGAVQAAFGEPSQTAALAWGAGAAALVLAAFRRAEGTLRDALAFAAWAAVMTSVLLATHESETAAPVAVAWASCALFFLDRAVRSRTFTWAPRLSLAAASLFILVRLTLRPEYQYSPFFTYESAGAAAILIAALVASRVARPISSSPPAWSSATLAAFLFAFCWVHQELAFAVSRDVATLLLVSYYAACSVACVGFGRARSIASLRHTGLTLGLVAGVLAVKGASSLSSVGARIASYLVVSIFLLFIAWWYRQLHSSIE